ncbi:hypothetical protein N7499_002827 [Penicillium canescens]|nr:hypothetical protein N7499_002827 [Penicillium canescens]KAJ6166442.1 hypothetical protein N7485_009686 [Penicillium canescens]
MRCDTPYQAWRDRPPDSRAVPPHVYLRPAEDLDIGGVVEIMNWYTRKTSLGRDIEPWTFGDYDDIHELCRKNRFPFLIAARRDHEDLTRSGLMRLSDTCVGELLVFVEEDYKKDHIGRALVGMTLSCLYLSYKRSERYEFVQSEAVDVEYGPLWAQPYHTGVCSPSRGSGVLD